MLKNFVITGDTHGDVATRLEQIFYEYYIPEETGVIILGDAGFNYFLNKTDEKTKQKAEAYGCYIYCVRGNHEERPQNISSYTIVYDKNVDGHVWFEKEHPLIRFFIDGCEYNIKGYSVLVIGGAYSVDKYYRILRAGLTEETNDPKKSGWFSSELLTKNEMNTISDVVKGKSYDFVLTHCAPTEFVPRDLFLNFIDQSTVDTTMEDWLDEIKNTFSWKHWLFGHYHASRVERPHVEQLYKDFGDIDAIVDFWNEYDLSTDENFPI